MNANTATELAPRELAPRSPSRAMGAWIARWLVRLAAQRAGVDVVQARDSDLEGDGTDLKSLSQQGADARPRIVINRPVDFYRRMARGPKLAIGEGYTAGDWTTAEGTDLADSLTPFAAHISTLLPGWLMRMRRIVDRQIPDDHRGAQKHVKEHISAHYDLGNEMFAAFLDPTLTYSSARFDPAIPLSEQSLESAQLRKIDQALDAAEVGPGTNLLEIGTGWGTLAIRAAQRGARVTTLTLSVEQAALAQERVTAAGLADQIEIRVSDYRGISGTFDAAVSIEMIEAVGERYWPDYFGQLSSLVRPGGAIVVQSILMSHERYLATRHSFGWIQKHIFPGGLIPSQLVIERQAKAVGLLTQRIDSFASDYAETLRRWRLRFLEAWPRIGSEGFGEDFGRAWEFYFAYCEAGFRAEYLDVAQFKFIHAQGEL